MSGFNVAASIKMRKSSNVRRAPPRRISLQCGRIYKDAEIDFVRALSNPEKTRFNVAASIKMRKFTVLLAVVTTRVSFNVAASIKMRKSDCCRIG